MKQFVIAMTMLFVCVLAIWVAFRLAPETWAMIAGVVFGLLASLPMCGIVLLMLWKGRHQEPERRPAADAYYPPQPPMMLVPVDRNGYPVFAPQAASVRDGYYLPPGLSPEAPAPPPLRAARNFVDRAQGAGPAWHPEPEPWVDADSYEVPEERAWDMPEGSRTAGTRAAGPRILGY